MAKRSKRRSKQHRLLETTEGAGLGRAQAANHRQDRHGLSRALTEARNQSTISARLRASCSSQRSFRSTSIASQRHAWASSTPISTCASGREETRRMRSANYSWMPMRRPRLRTSPHRATALICRRCATRTRSPQFLQEATNASLQNLLIAH